MENQHRLIKTYRELSQSEIDDMNSVKSIEASLNTMIDAMKDRSDYDQRHVAIAEQQLETGFMYLVKAIAKPARETD